MLNPITRPVPTGTSSAGRLKVLILEDHDDTRSCYQKVLEQSGHTVTAVSTLREAREAVGESKFDLAFCDIGLPDGTGWEFMEAFGKNPPFFAIALSGLGMENDMERSLKAGFRRHIVKPPSLREIFASVAEAEAEKSAA